jgi:DNA-binding NarL/FixJ family response regulator
VRDRISVLLADDSEIMRRAIRSLLFSNPQVVIIGEAGDYSELIKVLGESTPEVVLMDMHMPSVEGMAPHVVKDRLGGSCVLAMSIWADEETAGIARSYGALLLLDKSNLAATLITAIEECTREMPRKQQSGVLAIR